MISPLRFQILLALTCLVLSLGVEAQAQVGRLGGTVAYYTKGYNPTVARGVRVIFIGGYSRSETRTDNNGNFVIYLRAGEYRVVAQGASGYIQLQEVRGYVRQNTDSIIYPNPLYLVPQSRSRWGSEPSSPFSRLDWSAHGTAAPPSFASEITIRKSSTLREQPNSGEMGVVRGMVILKTPRKDTKPIQARVIASGYQRSETRTDAHGGFTMILRPGTWTIYVQKNGFVQGNIETVKLKKGEECFVTIYLLPHQSPKP